MVFRTSIVFICLFCALATIKLHGQLGFCEGDLGAPIFTEDFGTGTTNGPPLDVGTTTYTYVNNAPEDGFYTISSQMQQLGAFHTGPDHTPNDENGKAFIVNASFTADEFYRRTINGLCENTSYEFSAFLQNLYDTDSNVCSGNGIPVNVRFQIWNSTDTALLASGDTGAINGTASPIWTPYGLVFETTTGQTEVILKMINNGDGGCGNDLAIDDIVFRACGNSTQISSDLNGTEDIEVCNSESSLNTTLTVSTDPGVFIQWQTSIDGQTWTSITGANSESYEVSGLNSSRRYRVNTATDPSNLGNTFCSFFSNPYFISFIEGPDAPQSNGDLNYCENLTIPAISVVTMQNIEVRWFETSTSTEILATGSNFTPQNPGTYYAQSFVMGTNCGSTQRTAITVNALPAPNFTLDSESIEICENQEVKTLSAPLGNFTYVWSTGETSPSIEVSTTGLYQVTATNAFGCSDTKSFQVEGLEIPIISNIYSEGEAIVIELENEGNFQYSLDGAFYRNSPVFSNTPGGLYTVYVRNSLGCLAVTSSFYHFNIPTYFTPNNDGINDFFLLPDADFFESSFINIFDRFGKLLISGDGAFLRWDGTYNGKPLLANEYWYEIQTNDRIIVGHISLLR